MKLQELSARDWEQIVRVREKYPFPTDHLVADSVAVKAPLEKVFDFFKFPNNLSAITPPQLNIALKKGNPNLPVSTGSSVTYTCFVYKFPLPWHAYFPYVWQTEDSAGFVDLGLKTAFRRWCHIHEFKKIDDRTTLITDWLRWELPLGSAISAFTQPVVDAQLRNLFVYRKEKLIDRFGEAAGKTGI